jgi:hypothetical protein
MSDSNTGRPASRLIDITVNTYFPIQEDRLAELRSLPWVEQVNRRRKQCGVQLIVRCLELPERLGGVGFSEVLRTEVEKILCG